MYVFDVTDFGAVAGGGTVLLGGHGTYRAGTLELKSNLHLHMVGARFYSQ